MKTINVGDWVKWDYKGKIEFLKVTRVAKRKMWFMDESVGFLPEIYDYMEKVTEPWKIMLLNSGRKTPEFKPNDVIVTHQDLYLAGYHDHDEIVLLFEENLVIRFCPEENSIEVKS